MPDPKVPEPNETELPDDTAQKDFEDIIRSTIEGLKTGRTPNPRDGFAEIGEEHGIP